MASDARPGRSRHFRGGRLEDDHVYAALMRDRDEARERERRALAGRNEAMDRLAAAARDRDEARAETEQAQEHLGRSLVWEARYREALERIATGHSGTAPDPLPLSRWEMRNLARAALRGGDGHE